MNIKNEIIAKQDELIQLYSRCLKNSAIFLHVHHWKEKPEDIELGERLRNEIINLKENIKL